MHRHRHPGLSRSYEAHPERVHCAQLLCNVLDTRLYTRLRTALTLTCAMENRTPHFLRRSTNPVLSSNPSLPPPRDSQCVPTADKPVNSSIVLRLSASSQEVEKALDEIKQKKSVLIDEIHRLQNEISLCSTEIELLDVNALDGTAGITGAYGESQLRSKILALGARKFNSNPTEGIEYLMSNHLLTDSPQEVAMFLYREPKLSKTAIGNYLGTKDDFTIKVLTAFAALHEFHDVQLLEALRRFLGSFRLPGESQQIDRILQAFADRYQECNLDAFASNEVVYFIAYGIIMLNTSLHNKAASKSNKMNADDFVRLVRGSVSDVAVGDKSACVSDDMLRIIYENVRRQPFQQPDEDFTMAAMNRELAEIFFNPDKEGWMYKLGGNFRTWKRRWFILTGCCLYYFEFTTDKTPRGIIPLAGGLAVRNISDMSKPHCFEIYSTVVGGRIKARKMNEIGRHSEGNHSFYRFSAPSHTDKQEWMQALRNAMENVSIEAQPVLVCTSSAQ